MKCNRLVVLFVYIPQHLDKKKVTHFLASHFIPIFCDIAVIRLKLLQYPDKHSTKEMSFHPCHGWQEGIKFWAKDDIHFSNTKLHEWKWFDFLFELIGILYLLLWNLFKYSKIRSKTWKKKYFCWFQMDAMNLLGIHIWKKCN